MIKINGYSVKELSEYYNIPIKTIYTWRSRDPENVFDRIVGRRVKDIRDQKSRKIQEIKLEVEELNKKDKTNRKIHRLAIVIDFVIILILVRILFSLMGI